MLSPFHSPRVTYRNHGPANLDALHRWVNDREIQDLSNDVYAEVPRERTEQRLARWIRNDEEDTRHLALHLRGSDRLIGFAHLVFINQDHGTCKVGIVIGEKDCWGQGLGTEILGRLVRYVFEDLGLRRIAGEVFSSNPRSSAMVERVGFVREGILRETVRKGDGYIDEYAYGLLRREWNPEAP